MPNAAVTRPGPAASLASVARTRRMTQRLAGSTHRADAVDGLHGADQHGRGATVGLRDDVEAVVHAVDKIDVRHAGRPEHDPVPRRGSHAGVRGAVALADVGLDLDDPPDARRLAVPDQAGADQRTRGGERVSGQHLAREDERRRVRRAIRGCRAGRRAATLRAGGHHLLKTTFACSGMRNPKIAIRAGIAVTCMNCPMLEPSSDVQNVRRNPSSSSSGGMLVYR